MVYSISGRLAVKREHFVVVETAGLGMKVLTHQRTISSLPLIGAPVKFFCSLFVREDSLHLYGFLSEEELNFFELLNSVVGVGPRSALAVLEISDPNDLMAAIKEGRPDLLTRASGIGRKGAERIILELKNKVAVQQSAEAVQKMESDADIAEALVGLGYRRDQARMALQKVDEKIVSLEDRLKAALKFLSGKR